MKKITLYFTILLLFIWLGLFISKDSGYILIAYNKTTIETTLWAGVIAILIVFLMLYFLTRLITNLQHLPVNLKKWRLNIRAAKARLLLKKGILAIITGEWKKADNNLTQALKTKNNDIRLINYLACAYLADKQKKHDKCDNYLSLAILTDKKFTLEIELLRAQFQTKNEQWHEAQITLNQIRKTNPKHKMLLFLLNKTYLYLKEWHNLQLLIPLLRRYKILTHEDIISLEKLVYKELLIKNINSGNIDKTNKLWHKMPRLIHQNTEIIAIYISFLLQHGLHSKAERIFFKILPKIWSETIIEQYGTFSSTKPLKQLKIAEKWLQNHKQDAVLLLCLGRICKQQKLWGKAREYLEQSLKISPKTDAYYELGQIMEMQNDTIAALEYYKKGLKGLLI